VALLSLLSGCAAVVPQTTVMPKTDAARKIQDLYVLVFWLSVIVFIATQGGLLYILWRYRSRPGHDLPPQTHGNTVLEVGWTIAPAIVLVIMAVPTIRTIFELETPPTVSANNGGSPLVIEVTGKQWWWEFKYPEYTQSDGNPLTTANEMIVPVNRTVVLHITSDNVIHSFWIPQLTGKIDAIPNHHNELWFTPEEAGQYFGQCAEYCGVQHAQMRMNAIAMNPPDFQAWVQRSSNPAVPENTPLAVDGAAAFQLNGCAGCHTVAGTSATGVVGPNLSHIGSRTMIAASIMPNTDENLARWLRNPQEVKPGAGMPNLNLRPQDIDALVEYLHSLK
jgi:cytochrome c oxidase subunit 2